MLSLPVMLETDTILTLWLKTVPDFTVSFVRILLWIMIIDAMARPLMVAAISTGNVKKYQTIVGCILISIVPIAYIVLKLGGKPSSVYFVHLSVAVVAFVARLLIIKPLIKLSIRHYTVSVIIPCMAVITGSFGLSIIIRKLLPTTILYETIICVSSVLIVAVFAYFIGLSKGERAFINGKISEIYNKIIQHD